MRKGFAPIIILLSLNLLNETFNKFTLSAVQGQIHRLGYRELGTRTLLS